ncbi:TRAP transporter substrate-binding protein [Natribacillus halophilus]|uniref:TRAP-type C4-dicarboxylate transport system, substrate-binding protein n=1 Tax=Natribacillus halophilus TaxID=549003 RepID=A0A1G8R9W8_9BACI|nr:TRAP transporter substrate-binding protein [Natribacillus halophilus]SDJ13719.1 TRAP-type C4-dicarboxylate transport system, substrate-binding protein [Natribacillus halophilus]
MEKLVVKSFSMLVIVSLGLIGCGDDDVEGDSETVELLTNTEYPEDSNQTEILQNFSEEVEEATDGEVVIDVASGGSLGYDGEDALRAVRDNSVPVSYFIAGDVTGEESLFGVVNLPFAYSELEDSQAMSEVTKPHLNELLEEEWNQKLLYISPWPFSGFWTQDEVQSLGDLEGMDMRAYDEMSTQVINAVDAAPNNLPFGEVYSGLSTGVIDSVLTSAETAVDGSFWEVLDYHIPVNVLAGWGAVTINLDEWNSLDSEMQDAVVQAAEKVEADAWDAVEDLDEQMIDTVEENGIEVLEPSEELMDDLEESTEEIRENWLEENPEAQEIVDEYEEVVDQ